jgi:hypothetical protein
MLSIMKWVHTETLKVICKTLARCCDPEATPYQNVKENTFYPKKRVNKDKVWWEDDDEEYKPEAYNNNEFLKKGMEMGWAHKDWHELSAEEKNNILTSTLPFWDSEKDQVVLMTVGDACCKDERGRPLNPLGRTGVSGRGSLGKYGANHAADLIPVYFNPSDNTFCYLTVRRRDTHEVACAGGMIDPGDQAKLAKQATNVVLQTSKNAATREIVEEAISEEGAAVLQEYLADPNNTIVIAAGVVDDARNTDFAFMVSTVIMAPMPKELAMKIKLQKENDEVEAVAWRTLQEIEDDAKGVFASHMSFFKIAERKMQELKDTNRLPGMMTPPSLKRSFTFVPDDDMKRFKTESVNSLSTRFHNIGMHAAYPFARR